MSHDNDAQQPRKFQSQFQSLPTVIPLLASTDQNDIKTWFYDDIKFQITPSYEVYCPISTFAFLSHLTAAKHYPEIHKNYFP